METSRSEQSEAQLRETSLRVKLERIVEKGGKSLEFYAGRLGQSKFDLEVLREIELIRGELAQIGAELDALLIDELKLAEEARTSEEPPVTTYLSEAA